MLTPVYQDWSYPTNASITAWPGGSTVGDLAVMVLMPKNITTWWSRSGVPTPAGWTRVGWLYDSAYVFDFFGLGYYGHVFTKKVTAAAPNVSLYQGVGRLITIPGAFGVGTIRNGVRKATVKANGGVIVISEIGPDSSPSADFSGATLLSGLMSVSVSGNTYLRSRVAWASSATAAVIGVTDESVFASSDDAITLEILPPRAPLAPVVVAPTSGQEISDTGGVSFGWAHTPVLAGGSQDAYRLRVKAVSSGTWQWWNSTTAALVGSETSNTTSTSTLGLSSVLFTSGTQYEVQVATREALDGQWSPYSVSATFTPVAAPSVVITSSGTWSGDLTPTIAWTPTTPRGAQVAWRVSVVYSAVTLHDSGWQTGSNASYTLPVLDWTNGAAHTLSLQIRQSGGSESAVVTQALTVSWSAPSVPVVVASAAADNGVGLGISVASAPADCTVEVERQLVSDPEETWAPVFTVLYPASGTLAALDVLAPYGEAVTYRARAIQELDGVSLRSAWGESGTVTSTDDRAYVVNDQDRTDWLEVRIVEDGAVTLKQDIAVNYGKGNDVPFVDYSPPQGFSGSMTLSTWAEADTLVLREWLLSNRNMLLRLPPYAGVNVQPRKFARTSLAESHLDQSTMVDIRHTTFDWVSQ